MQSRMLLQTVLQPLVALSMGIMGGGSIMHAQEAADGMLVQVSTGVKLSACDPIAW